MTSEPAVRQSLGEALGANVATLNAVPGGDVCSAYRATMEDGRECFLKTHPEGERMFEAEAAGLRWLGAAEAIRIPSVLAVTGGPAPLLVLEFLAAGPRSADYDEELGRGLAALHAAGPGRFGWPTPNFIGPLPQDNLDAPDWPTFYGERRLLPLTKRAVDRRLLDAGSARALESIAGSLDRRCGPPEPPARLHGDLWSGNVIVDEHGSPALVDPAVYGGHREMDLAMMALFGGFSSRTLAAYDEAYPRAPGAERRIPLYQLYPLLVHVNLFGASYVGQLRGCVEALG